MERMESLLATVAGLESVLVLTCLVAGVSSPLFSLNISWGGGGALRLTDPAFDLLTSLLPSLGIVPSLTPALGWGAVDPVGQTTPMEDTLRPGSGDPLIVSAPPRTGVTVRELVTVEEVEVNDVEDGYDWSAPDTVGRVAFLGFRGGGGALLFVFRKTLMHRLEPVRRALSKRALKESREVRINHSFLSGFVMYITFVSHCPHNS